MTNATNMSSSRGQEKDQNQKHQGGQPRESQRNSIGSNFSGGQPNRPKESQGNLRETENDDEEA